MASLIVFVGGTMNTEKMLVASAAAGQITIPAMDGLPEETYSRLDPYDQMVVRFGYVPTTTTKEGSPA